MFIYIGGSAAAIVAIAARGQESLVAEDCSRAEDIEYTRAVNIRQYKIS